MDRRATIALLLVAVLLAGFLVLTRTGTLSIGPEEEAEAEEPGEFEPLFDEAQNDIVSGFVITDNESNASFSAELADDGSWSVTEAGTDPAEGQVVDQGRMTTAASTLSTLVTARELSEIESLTEFGLDSAPYTLTFRTLGGGEFTLDIGGKTPQNAHYYTQREGDIVVHLVSAAVLDAFIGFLSEPPYAEPTPTFAPPPTPES